MTPLPSGRFRVARRVAAGIIALVSALASAADDRPNIIFIMADDHAAHALSAYGSRINRTPNLDRLANEGMLFRNTFCTNSICAPSRAVILTGKYSHLNGVIDNATVFDGGQLTVPKLLQKAGYQTAMIGKWHLKSDPTGFDYWNILPGQGVYHDPDMIEMGKRSKQSGYVTDIITDKALEWLEQRQDDKPFFLMYQHKAPHRRWNPDDKHADMYEGIDIPLPATFDDDYATRSDAARTQAMTVERHLTAQDLKVPPPEGLSGAALKKWKYQRYIKDYLRCVASIDDNVGRLLDYLDKSGLAKNTMVIYTSDQGFFLGDHGWYDKRFMYEHSLRMPLLVRYPPEIKPGSVSDALSLNLDFAPTFLDLAGADIPAAMQGRSLRPLLKGETPPNWRKSMYYNYYEYQGGGHMVRPHYGVRTQRYKLMHFHDGIDAWELFDLQKDPDELNNVYDNPAYAGTVKELKSEIARLQRQYGDSPELVKELTAKSAEHFAPRGKSLGPVRHPDFAWAQDAEIAASDGGYDITGKHQGYALKKTPRPITKRATFRCTFKTLRKVGTRNGFIVFGDDKNPQSLIKCGVYIAGGEYVILHGSFDRPAADDVKHAVVFDRDKTFDITVHVDLESRRIVMNIDGKEISAPIGKAWNQISYYGYAANRTSTHFGPIEVRSE
ncbi:MAG: sulfatase [Planctomycetes bacterium]|nr:sulfatase [Planctomycetota bacterium]